MTKVKTFASPLRIFQTKKELEELDIEQMTPLDAFDKLVELRKRVKRG